MVRSRRAPASRALDEPAAEPLFEPLQLQADRGVRTSSAARVEFELSDAHEKPERIEAERPFNHFPTLSLISLPIAYQNSRAG